MIRLDFACRPALVLVALVLAGCTSQRAPLALDSSFRAEDVDELLVLPVIDARPDPFQDVLLSRDVGDAMVRFLRERGYFTLAADAYGQRPTGPLDLGRATFEQLVSLAPEDAGYFLVVQIERLEPGGKQDSSVSDARASATMVDRPGGNQEVPVVDARLSAVMVDRPGGRVVWRDVATASSSLSGFLTLFARGSRPYEAAVNASKALVETLPRKGGDAK